MEPLELGLLVVGFAVSAFTAFGFYKAGKFKAFSSRETLLQAGFGWIEKIPFGLVRLIAWLELIGAAGLLLAPVGYLVGFGWAIWFAVAAGIGLALTMFGAMLVHAARKETKFTWKMNLQLLAVALLSAGLWAAFALS